MHVKPPSFYQLMQYTLYLQYCGFSLPVFTIRNNRALVIKELSIWLELMILFSVAFGQTYLLIKMQDMQGSDVVSILSYAFTFTSIAFILISGWEMKTKSQLMKSVFEKIKALDETITLENNQLNYLTVQVIIWSVAIIATTVASIMSLLFYGNLLFLGIFGAVSTLKIYVTPAAHSVQFFTLITLVRYYMEWIDKQLSKIRQLNLDGKDECKQYMSFRPHFRDEHCKTANNIQNIRKIYGRVHDLKRDINELYNVRLWMDITGTAFRVLYFIYFNLLIVKRRSKLKLYEGNDFTQFYLQYWIVFLMLKFLENIRICGKVTACGKNIGVKVHEIFSSSYCEDVRNELTTFSLELLHRDPHIKANNIFNIDYPLTASVVRGIVMQLIALLQINVPDNQNEYLYNFYGSEPRNVTLQTQNNSVSEAPTMTV